MNIATLEKEVNFLKREISEIKEVFLGCMKDEEGEYNTEFVKEILNIAKRKPIYRYTQNLLRDD